MRHAEEHPDHRIDVTEVEVEYAGGDMLVVVGARCATCGIDCTSDYSDA